MSASENKTTSIENSVSQFIDAGIGLAMLPFTLAQQSFSSTKEDTAKKLSELQARGEKLESKVLEQFNPSKLCQQFFQSLSPKSNREAKIEQLSAKVDTLVELVATLAAKKAAEAKTTKATAKAPAEKSATEAKPVTRTRTTTRKTTAKSTAKPRTTTRARTQKKDT